MRLELTRRSDIAVRALQKLSAAGGRVSRPDLAAAANTTPDFLARVMMVLVSRGWVASWTGPAGGYEITSHAREASVFDLIEAVEGVPEDGRCVLRGGPCPPVEQCALHEAWTRARKALLEELRGTPILSQGET